VFELKDLALPFPETALGVDELAWTLDELEPAVCVPRSAAPAETFVPAPGGVNDSNDQLASSVDPAGTTMVDANDPIDEAATSASVRIPVFISMR
jgi:hypothetical protein